jgi:hypothetical protein
MQECCRDKNRPKHTEKGEDWPYDSVNKQHTPQALPVNARRGLLLEPVINFVRSVSESIRCSDLSGFRLLRNRKSTIVWHLVRPQMTL